MTDAVDLELVQRLHRSVGDQLQQAQTRRRAAGEAPYRDDNERQYARSLISTAIRGHAEELLERGDTLLDPGTEQDLAEAVYARMYGAGRLQRLLDDDSVENIDINGPAEVWVSRADGQRFAADPVAASDEELIELIQTLGSYAGLSSRPFDAANPQLDLRLPDGSRLSALQQVTVHPAVSIRRNRFVQVTLTDLVGNGTLTPELADFLGAAVRARMNVMIAGATNSGKTTTLRALASEIGPEERLITVERALELGLRADVERHPDCVEMEERIANSEGRGEITMAELVRRTLRMNPSRVIVGEVLGPEIVTMLNAMGQGNDGSLSTIHARTAREVFNRISTYAAQSQERLPREASFQMVAGALDFVVFMDRDRHTGARQLSTVLEVNSYDAAVGVIASEIFGRRRGDQHALRNRDVAVSRETALIDAGWQDGDVWGESG